MIRLLRVMKVKYKQIEVKQSNVEGSDVVT